MPAPHVQRDGSRGRIVDDDVGVHTRRLARAERRTEIGDAIVRRRHEVDRVGIAEGAVAEAERAGARCPRRVQRPGRIAPDAVQHDPHLGHRTQVAGAVGAEHAPGHDPCRAFLRRGGARRAEHQHRDNEKAATPRGRPARRSVPHERSIRD